MDSHTHPLVPKTTLHVHVFWLQNYTLLPAPPYIMAVSQALISDAEGRGLCRLADSVYNSPLHIAARNGHREEVKVLLAANVKVDARNDVGKTPLHLAAESGHHT